MKKTQSAFQYDPELVAEDEKLLQAHKAAHAAAAKAFNKLETESETVERDIVGAQTALDEHEAKESITVAEHVAAENLRRKLGRLKLKAEKLAHDLRPAKETLAESIEAYLPRLRDDLYFRLHTDTARVADLARAANGGGEKELKEFEAAIRSHHELVDRHHEAQKTLHPWSPSSPYPAPFDSPFGERDVPTSYHLGAGLREHEEREERVKNWKPERTVGHPFHEGTGALGGHLYESSGGGGRSPGRWRVDQLDEEWLRQQPAPRATDYDALGYDPLGRHRDDK